ncbi:hypothetical protein F1737_08175 [Methanoplanus sp. FWC-SCC4]|uniref:Uncharacterized protein n=1 Tax=Methanochimaera problematica TaxID=2609417 RepID=A0AA97FDR3_9EURY|nr:hypothetical protein [Methanoplanus sp. FWC-SCC4]WOF16667.1 hypothetical protein F1737_08175 [Methanoplanus sp. FWC-SCC4]
MPEKISMTGKQPKTAGDVVSWCRNNGVIPVPCRPKSKAPLGIISVKGVYGENPPGERELLRNFDRRFFGKTVRDSFHIPSQKRLEIIENYWNRPYTKSFTAGQISVSLDMNYPTKDGLTIACIDIDTDDLAFLADEELFQKCPLISGKKGGKLFFKLNKEKALPSPIIQYTTKENLEKPGTEQKPALIELFTGHKHALIFGEHPESTPEKPLYYQFLRGFDEQIPVITWADTTAALNSFSKKHGLLIRMTNEVVPYDQTNLSEWENKKTQQKKIYRTLGQNRIDRW